MQNQFLAGAALLLAATLSAQTSPAAPAAPPSFEVASIKVAPPLDPMKMMQGKMHIGMSVDAARVDIGSASLADLIRIAYHVKEYQVSGPDWMKSQRFDILAKMPEGSSKEQAPEMLQALLADRFKMTVHHETKEHAVYALIVGKTGSKLKPAAADAVPPPPPADAPSSKPGMSISTPEGQMRVSPNAEGKGATIAGGPFGQMKISMGEGGMMQMEFASISMPMLSDMLTRFTDRPVLDMTELKGNFQVTLELSMEEMRNVARAAAMQAGIALPGPGGRGGGETGRSLPSEEASTPTGNSVLSAVQQLGLKLDARKEPVDTVVVDHVEKTPTEN